MENIIHKEQSCIYFIIMVIIFSRAQMYLCVCVFVCVLMDRCWITLFFL